jgi:hypothetical protein
MRLRTDGVRESCINALEEAEVDVRAMRELSRSEFCRSWVVTGYFSADEMAKLSGLGARTFMPHFSKKRKFEARMIMCCDSYTFNMYWTTAARFCLSWLLRFCELRTDVLGMVEPPCFTSPTPPQPNPLHITSLQFTTSPHTPQPSNQKYAPPTFQSHLTPPRLLRVVMSVSVE